MQFQQFDKFVLKGGSFMVPSLVLDVFDDLRSIRFTDREHAVSILPCKSAQMGKFSMDPKRAITFQPLSDLAWSDRRRRAGKRVNVIIDPADLQCGHTMCTCDPADIGPYAVLYFGRN